MIVYGPQREKTCLLGFANNTGVNQPAHPRRLISAFVSAFFGKYCILTCYKPNVIFLASPCSWGDWFDSHFNVNPEDRFSCDETHMISKAYSIICVWWKLFIINENSALKLFTTKYRKKLELFSTKKQMSPPFRGQKDQKVSKYYY